MRNRLAHKWAWWLRRWAEKLEPQVKFKTPIIDEPILFDKREYRLNPLRVRIDKNLFEGQDFHDLQIIKAQRQIGQAVEKIIEERTYSGPSEPYTTLQLLILSPADHVYKRNI